MNDEYEMEYSREDELLEQIANLEKENKELKTVKIPQLERRIASIRGCHSADAKKLNARIEQVERLKQENAEIRKRNGELAGQKANLERWLSEAKELLREIIDTPVFTQMGGELYENEGYTELVEETEQFLTECK